MKALLESFDRKFWFVNLMEFMERWAYYGVRVVLSVYIVKAASEGGLEFNHIQKGQIYSAWAIIQSTLPILTGGYADKYGYRKVISLAIILKVIGYLLMATQHSFFGFLSGCMFLASGTAVFKPAVQGVLASNLHSKNSSMGWGIFYWLINWGGFLGSWLAGYFRMIDWSTVFYANALIVSLNFIFLFFSPSSHSIKSESLEEKSLSFWKLPLITVKEMFEPKLILFLLIYSGYWAMYNQLFDTLPNFLDDWVNSSKAVRQMGAWFGKNWSGPIPHEWILSINTMTFIILMLPLSWLVRNLHPIYSIVGGILLTIVGMGVFGSSMSAWICIAGIIIFSVGEMGAGPRMREYLGLIAPKGKEGRYMGYANLPEAIGWGLGSLIAGYWYENYSDKHSLAKQYFLHNLNWSAEEVNHLQKENILPILSEQLNLSQLELTQYLWQINNPQNFWYWFMLIALVSAIGLVIHHFVFKVNINKS